MISWQTLAVAIADAIRDPEGRRLLSALAEREPVGLLDQSRAAARDADTLAVALTEDLTGRWDSPVEFRARPAASVGPSVPSDPTLKTAASSPAIPAAAASASS